MSKVFKSAGPVFWSGMAVLFLFITSLAQAAKPAPPTPPPAPAYHGPEYYFTIELDPRYQFTGTGQLTEEDAAKANCYRFLYNGNGKLQEIEYRRAGVLMPDPVFGVGRIDFEYKPGVELRWFRDPQGRPVADLDGIFGEELTLNAAGYPIGITSLDQSGGHTRDNSGVTRYARTLDEHNRLIVAQRLGLFGTPITDDSGFYETHTAYDAQGHTVERSNYDASGKLLNNEDGVAQVRSTYTIYPDSTQIIQSYFDAANLPVEEKSDGVHQRQTTFDNRGFLVDERYFDNTGAPTVNGDDSIHERRYTYDSRGNQTSEEYFDVNGQPTDRKGPNASDYAKLTYKYDDLNRVIEKDYFGDDGKPQVNAAVGAAMIRQEYNKRGDLVRRVFLDGQGHPSQHASYLAPAIRVRVDGDTTTVYLRNEADEPAKNPVNGYSAFSYKTATDHPLSIYNKYYDIKGRQMSLMRVRIINPHLHQLRTNWMMKWNARGGAAAAGLGALLGCWLALKKSSHTKRRKVWVPTPIERFLGWFAVLAIFEGMVRFFLTLYWAWVGYQNGHMGRGFYVLESIFLLFMLYRLYRQTCTMRVLNIERDDIHRLVKDFFAKAGLKPEWVEHTNRYVTPPLDLRVNYFLKKFHAYLAFTPRGETGHQLARDANSYIRAQSGGILGPVRSKGLAAYYPLVALCYFLLAFTAFYTLYQLLKG